MEYDDLAQRHYDEYIASALRTEGGHLSIGRGFTLYYAGGARLSDYDCERVKACCIAAGLPVIDSRLMAFITANSRLRMLAHRPLLHNQRRCLFLVAGDARLTLLRCVLCHRRDVRGKGGRSGGRSRFLR